MRKAWHHNMVYEGVRITTQVKLRPFTVDNITLPPPCKVPG